MFEVEKRRREDSQLFAGDGGMRRSPESPAARSDDHLAFASPVLRDEFIRQGIRLRRAPSSRGEPGVAGVRSFIGRCCCWAEWF
jgi:hypothetical protein